MSRTKLCGVVRRHLVAIALGLALPIVLVAAAHAAIAMPRSSSMSLRTWNGPSYADWDHPDYREDLAGVARVSPGLLADVSAPSLSGDGWGSDRSGDDGSAGSGPAPEPAPVAQDPKPPTPGPGPSRDPLPIIISGPKGPALRAEETEDRTTARPGDKVTYRVRVFNVGSTDAPNVTITSFVPDGTTYSGGVACDGQAVRLGEPGQTPSCVDASSVAGDPGIKTVSKQVANLQAGSYADLVFAVTVNAGTPSGTKIPNQGSAKGSNAAEVRSNQIVFTVL